MTDCTCPSVRCPIHGEPLPEPTETCEIDIPAFIREHRMKEQGIGPCEACGAKGGGWVRLPLGGSHWAICSACKGTGRHRDE